MQRWAYTPISEVNAHSKSHPSGNLGWIKRYVSIREHGVCCKWLLQWFILINQGRCRICSSGWKGGPAHTLNTHHIRRASEKQAKSWRPLFEGAKAVFTFIYGSCRLNPTLPLPSDGTLQTNYRGLQKKTRRMWEENKHHLRCFWWQICIAFNQGSNSTVDKSLLYSRWQQESILKNTAMSATCLCQIKRTIRGGEGFHRGAFCIIENKESSLVSWEGFNCKCCIQRADKDTQTGQTPPSWKPKTEWGKRDPGPTHFQR